MAKDLGPGASMLPTGLTAQNCGLLGVHFQSPQHNFGVGSMPNAPWILARSTRSWPSHKKLKFVLSQQGQV